MYDDFKELDQDKKDLAFKNDRLTKNFLIVLLRQAYTRQDKEQDNEQDFSLNDYEFYDYILYNISDKNTINKDGELTRQMENAYKTLLNNSMIDDVYKEYTNLAINGGKQVLYTLSRLLYLQDKYKDSEIGQEIDKAIKEWLELIKSFDENKDPKKYKQDLIKTRDKDKRTQIIKDYNRKLNARVLYQIIPSLNYDIYAYRRFRPYTTIWNYDEISNEDFIGFLDNYINNRLNDSKTYNRYDEDFNKFINDLESIINIDNFERDKAKEIQDIKDKYGITDVKEHNEGIDQDTQNAFVDEIASLYHEYLEKDKRAFKIQDDNDIKIWRDKADKFIKHLETYDGVALNGLFTMDYTLEHLAYNDYQKKAYKLDLEDDIKVIKDKSDTTTPVQDDTEQEDEQTPISKLRNHSLKHSDTQERDYIMMSSTKQANDLVNSMTSYASYNESIYSIQKNINELENKGKKSASDKDRLDYLKDKLANRIKTREELEQEEKQLIDTKKEISEKLTEIDDQDDINYLTGLSKDIDKRLEQIKTQKNDSALVVQQNLFTNDIEYNGKYITTSIDIDNFDLSKFTDEGIKIFLYMIDQIITNPNIKDLTFDIDFIFNKMNKYKHNKKSVVRKEIENLTDILYNMNIRVIKEDRLNNLEVGRELRVITGRQWVKDKKEIKDSNGLKSMTITFNPDFKTMILNSKTKTTRLGDVKQVNQLQYFKIPLDLIRLKNKKVMNLGLYLLQEAKLNRKNIERGIPLKRTMKNLYNNNYLKLKYNKKQGQFKKDIVYKLEDYLNQLEDNKIILYNTDAFDKLRYDLSNKPIEEQKRIFDEEIIEIRVIPQIISKDDEATIN